MTSTAAMLIPTYCQGAGHCSQRAATGLQFNTPPRMVLWLCPRCLAFAQRVAGEVEDPGAPRRWEVIEMPIPARVGEGGAPL
jgi:hypothetical protein